jgi:hypothetical protein
MEILSYEQLDERRDLINAAACKTPEISTYCSGTDWIMASSKHLVPRKKFYLSESDGHYALLARDVHNQIGPYLHSLEIDWGFASPHVGEKQCVGVHLLQDIMKRVRDWNCVFLAGVGLAAAQLTKLSLQNKFDVVVKEGTHCQISSLEGGVEAFLSRRSPSFRRSIRKAQRDADNVGLQFEHFQGEQDCAAWYQRIQDIEANTWKAREGKSIFANPRYEAFYGEAMSRAASDGRLRSVIAVLSGLDVGYIVGGVMENTYRGFQIGYADDFHTLSVGNLCQMAQIKTLCEEGITEYDLGMVIDYKSRWGEKMLSLYHVIIYRR